MAAVENPDRGAAHLLTTAVLAVATAYVSYIALAEHVARRATALPVCAGGCPWSVGDWALAVGLVGVTAAVVAVQWIALSVLFAKQSIGEAAREAVPVSLTLVGAVVALAAVLAPLPTGPQLGVGVTGVALVAVTGRRSSEALTRLHQSISDLPLPVRRTLTGIAVIGGAGWLALTVGDCRLGTCAAALPHRNSLLLVNTAVVLVSALTVTTAGLRLRPSRTLLWSSLLAVGYAAMQAAVTALQ